MFEVAIVALRRIVGALTAEATDHAGVVARLGRRIVEYEESFCCCEVHTPDVWDGDGTCVICEAVHLYDQVKELAATVARLTQERDAAARQVGRLIGELGADEETL